MLQTCNSVQQKIIYEIKIPVPICVGAGFVMHTLVHGYLQRCCTRAAQRVGG